MLFKKLTDTDFFKWLNGEFSWGFVFVVALMLVVLSAVSLMMEATTPSSDLDTYYPFVARRSSPTRSPDQRRRNLQKHGGGMPAGRVIHIGFVSIPLIAALAFFWASGMSFESRFKDSSKYPVTVSGLRPGNVTVKPKGTAPQTVPTATIPGSGSTLAPPRSTYQKGEIVWSQGTHYLCTDLSKSSCGPAYLNNGALAKVVAGPKQGKDGYVYLQIQVLQGSLIAEFGGQKQRATWWVQDVPDLFRGVDQTVPIPVQPHFEEGIVYVIDWPYQVRDMPAGRPLVSKDGIILTALGPTDNTPATVSFRGQPSFAQSPDTGSRWWCELATLNGKPIEEYLPESEREDGKWIACEFAAKVK